MPVPTLNEGSRCFIRAKFFDRNQSPQIPNSLQYRVDCETTGTVILNWTTLTPAQALEIQIDATLNNIIRPTNSIERKVVTVMANADPPSGAFTEIQEYDLLRLQALD